MRLRVKKFDEIPTHWVSSMRKYIGMVIEVEESYADQYDYMVLDNVVTWHFIKSDFVSDKYEKRIERMCTFGK